MSDPLRPLPPRAFEFREARHLLERAGFGGTPAQVATLQAMGLDAAVDLLVERTGVPARPVSADDFDRDIMRPATQAERRALVMARRRGDEAALDAARRQRQMAQRADREQIGAIRKWWLQRMIETPSPLVEKLVLFWHGHFATGYRKIENSYHLFLQNQTFRHHALGSFRDLTRAIIRDPAMIRYLDNERNVRRQPNENLARELMELFTLGEGNGYTEHDIKEAARALTGYSVEDDAFRFRADQHDDGMKSILGRRGRFDGDDLVDVLLREPVCSAFICHKLYRAFVNDAPGDPSDEGKAVVRALAQHFRTTDRFDVGSTLARLFRSAHFYEPANVGTMIKSPVQLIVQAARTLRPPARSHNVLLSAAALMGQDLMEPPSVKGWPGGRTWINTSTLFLRQNTTIYLLTGREPDARPWEAAPDDFRPDHLLEPLMTTASSTAELDPAEAVGHLLRFLLAVEPTEEQVETTIGFVESHGGVLTRDVLVATLVLITSMPEYQLC